MEESSANMEMIAIESENISKGTEGEGETGSFSPPNFCQSKYLAPKIAPPPTFQVQA